MFIFCFNHSMDQHLTHPDKETGTKDDTDSLDHNLELFFIVGCFAALFLVVIIQAFCIIRMSRRNSMLKNSSASLYHPHKEQPQHRPHQAHQAPSYHHNQGFQAEETWKTNRYEKNFRKFVPRKLSSEQTQGSGAPAYQAESTLRRSRRSAVAKVRKDIEQSGHS